MARLLSIGFEINSATAGYELDQINTPSGTVVAMATGRQGVGSLCCYFQSYLFGGPSATRQFLSTPTRSKFYVRYYFKTNKAPTGFGTNVFGLGTTSGSNYLNFTLNAAMQLVVGIAGGATGTAVISSSLAINQWYMIEVSVDLTDGVNALGELFIDGVSQGSYSYTCANGLNVVALSASNSDNSHQAYFDDIAINDDSGAYQNTFPGPGSIVLLQPTSDGEITSWNRTGGPTANWDCVDENSPNQSDYVSSNTLGQTDWYAVADMPSLLNNTINLVEVLPGINGNAGATLKFQLQIENGGTAIQSAAVTPTGSTSYFNSPNSPRNAPIVAYVDPQYGNPWNVDRVAKIQVGQTVTATGSTASQIFAIYVIVEYTDTLAGSVLSISNVSSISSISSIVTS